MFPDLELKIMHIYEDGDIVVSHNHAVLKKDEIENIVLMFTGLKTESWLSIGTVYSI